MFVAGHLARNDRQKYRQVGSHARRQTDKQTDRKTLPLELTALEWSKSLTPAFFGLINLGHFDSDRHVSEDMATIQCR